MTFPEWMQNRKVIAGAVIGAVVIAAAGSATWLLSGTPPPPPLESLDATQLREYVASKNFGAQPIEVRKQYFAKLREAGPPENREEMTQEQREQFRQNMGPIMQEMMEERMNGYFEAPPDQKKAYLDRMIDEMQQHRRPPGGDRPPGDRPGGQGERRGGGMTAERMKRRIENTPADQRSRRMEFMKAMRKRMEERGIQPSGGGGPPR